MIARSPREGNQAVAISSQVTSSGASQYRTFQLCCPVPLWLHDYGCKQS